MLSNSREREEISWWTSRHGKHKSSTDAVRRSRRLTLLDIIFLAVMLGVLVPWVLRMNSEQNLGPYRVRIEQKAGRDEDWLVLEIRLKKSSEGISPEELIGWQIQNTEGGMLHEEWDIPPESGASRQFTYKISGESALKCSVHAGGETLVQLFENTAEAEQ